MHLRNDRERRQFLDGYRDSGNGWELWKEDKELERRWWRNKQLRGVILVVEEEMRTYVYPEAKSEWQVVHWYALGNAAPLDVSWKMHFGDHAVGKTAVMSVLKYAKLQEDG